MRGVVAALTALALLVVPTAAAAPKAAVVAPGRWCEDLERGNPVIDVLGDSMMSATAASQESYRWHQMLGQSLRDRGAQVWAGGAIDGSVTGDYVPGGRYANHVEFTVNRPSVVVLSWGIAQWAGQHPLDRYREDYQRIVDRIRVLSPQSTVLLVWPSWAYPEWMDWGRPVKQQQYQQVMREVAAANGVYFVGGEWWFPGDDRAGLYSPDRVHHNDRGQVVFYAGMRSYLLGLCGRG